MPFIEAAIADAREAEAVPEGPYDLRVISAEMETSKKGNTMMVVGIAIESSEYPNAAPMRDWIIIPGGDMEYKELHLRKLARFLTCFSIPHEDTGFDTDDVVGATAEQVLLTQETVEKDGDGNPVTPYQVNRPQYPRLAKEPEEEQEPASKKVAAGGKKRRR